MSAQPGAGHRHVVLIGLSGSGKSTVGPIAARRLGRPFVDTDLLVEAQCGAPPARIFAEQGEAAFRLAERDAVARAIAGPPAVIATGGGAPLDPVSSRLLRTRTLLVWLHAPVPVLAARLGADGAGRPLLAGDVAGKLAALEATRRTAYAAADLHVDTSRCSPDAAAAVIVDRVVEALIEPEGEREDGAHDVGR